MTLKNRSNSKFIIT